MSTKKASTKPAEVKDDIVDVDLSEIRKKRFRINGDNSKIIELNTSDINILERLDESYNKLHKLSGEASNYQINEDSEISDITTALKEIDSKMCDLIDYIFNAEVSKLFSDEGTMYDLFNGMFRYEYIIDKLSALYENNLNSEFKKLSQKINAKTQKYTSTRKKK